MRTDYVWSFILLICLGAALPVQAAESDIVAKMGSIEIKRDEFERLVGKLPAKPNSEQLQAMNQALRAELVRRALLAEAGKTGWDKKPEVEKQIEAARQQVVVTTFMNNQARPAADYPSDADVQAAYAANKSVLVRPAQVHLAQIYLKEQPKAEEASKLAHEKGVDFGALSKTYSQHADSAQHGGDMGWLALESLAPEIRSVVEKMAAGEVSKPVKGNEGWHVLKVIEKKAAEALSLSEAKPQIVQSLRLRKAQENEQQYLDNLLAREPLSINEIALSKIPPAQAK